MFTYNPNSLYINFLDFLNPKIINKDTSSISLSLDENGEIVPYTNLSVNMISGPRTFPINYKVKCLAKIEMAFHALNSKIVEEIPELNGENFSVIRERVKEYFGDDIIIPQCYEILRIIRNKFQHDKSENLTWDGDDLVIYNSGIKSLVISIDGLNTLIYLIWYSLKNNMNLLYNKILLNKFYYDLKGNLKYACYIEKNKRDVVKYEFNGLLDTNEKWNTFPVIGRTIVNALTPEKSETGFRLRRLKCFNDTSVPNKNNEFIEYKNAYTRALDYYFLIENEEYLIPDEFFNSYEDGDDAIISFDDIDKFKYISSEMAVF